MRYSEKTTLCSETGQHTVWLILIHCKSITNEQHQRYEKLVPQVPIKQNNCIQYDETKTYKFILFDTETTTMGKEAEICQLSAIDDAGQNEFSCYIMPESNVSKHATEIIIN